MAKPASKKKPKPPSRRFNPMKHAKWRDSVFGKGRVLHLADKYLTADREERPLEKRKKRTDSMALNSRFQT